MSTPAYYRYLQKRYQWTPRMMPQIHWTILQRSLDKFNVNDQRRLVLFINEKLPLRASKAHPHQGSPLCPLCQREHETPTHILVCEHPECKRLFTNLKATLTAVAQKLRLHPCILTAIWLGLTSVHNDSPYPDISQELSIPLWSPIQGQAQLGWTQLYQGQISHYWAQAIDELHPNLALSGEQVMTQLLDLIWNYILELWQTCNTHLHHQADQLDLPNYRQAIITLYKRCHQLTPNAQDALYRQPLDVILEQPTPQLQTYAQWGLAYFNRQLQAAKTQACLNTLDIRTFFGHQPQPPNDLQPP